MTNNVTAMVPEPINRFSSLGIGVDDVSMTEAVDRIVRLIQDYRLGQRPHLVATLNVDFMVNALGYFFSSPSHPELLEILRSADLVTADGFPIVLLSKIMGAPIKERVTGADLVPALAKRAAQDGFSLYFLGGQNGSARQAADRLQDENPGLCIAGTAEPMVHVTGKALADYEQEDESIVRAINESGADVLLIGFGNPKQEQWFYRNRHNLKVPVSIGVGGTFEFIAGRVSRAPSFFQKYNLEWVYRISQDPARLWKRYLKGLFKFGLLTLPILLIRLRELLHVGVRDSRTLQWNTLWGSRQDVIQAVQLPRYVSKEILENLSMDIRERFGRGRMVIVDFSRVRHIELAAHLAFFDLGSLFQSSEASGMLLGLRPSVRRRLEAGRIMDALQRHTTDFQRLNVPAIAGNPAGLNCRSYVLENAALIYLSGRADGKALAELGFDICIADMSRDRTCVIDLRYLEHLETTAVAKFARLVQSLPDSNHSVRFSGVTGQARTIFQLAGYDRKLNFIDDRELQQFLFSPQQEN